MIRFLITIGLLYLVYRILKSALLKGTHRQQGVAGKAGTQIDDVMVKDPFCGVYFPQKEGISARVKGETLFFCSQECKNKYLELHSK